MTALLSRPVSAPTTPEPDELTPEQLKELRELGEMTQKEFSKGLGYSRSAIEHMESGRRTIPAPVRRRAVELVERAINNEIRARQAKLKRLKEL